MITDYHRPKTLDEALTLLTQPDTRPLGGGTLLSHGTPDPVRVIDLQLLQLDSLTKNGNNLELGATLTLQALLESEHCPEILKPALKLEAPLNLRNSGTTAGTLVASDGRSTFATVLLAMDARIMVHSKQKGEETINIGDFLPLRDQIKGKLITKIILPINTKLAFDYVARTPSDKPIVCVALVQWNSGRTRMAVGGYGKSPMLAMDGAESDETGKPDFVLNSVQTAAKNAFHESIDEYGSAEYRMAVAATLAKRCLETLHE